MSIKSVFKACCIVVLVLLVVQQCYVKSYSSNYILEAQREIQTNDHNKSKVSQTNYIDETLTYYIDIEENEQIIPETTPSTNLEGNDSSYVNNSINRRPAVAKRISELIAKGERFRKMHEQLLSPPHKNSNKNLMKLYGSNLDNNGNMHQENSKEANPHAGMLYNNDNAVVLPNHIPRQPKRHFASKSRIQRVLKVNSELQIGLTYSSAPLTSVKRKLRVETSIKQPFQTKYLGKNTINETSPLWKNMSSSIIKWFGNKHHTPLTLTSRYLINPRNLCPPDKRLDYLILVHSSTKNFMQRQDIRDTFGKKDLLQNQTQRLVFILGKPKDAKTTKIIHNEAALRQDVVQGDFFDTYHNLTLKGVLGFRWIAEFCPNVDFVLKIDDDVFVNIFKVVKEKLPSLAGKTRSLVCQVGARGGREIFRTTGHKWHVPVAYFPTERVYPFDYCDGFFVIMTGDLIKPLLEAATVNPFFWIDDVYLFGMLPLTAGNVTHIQMMSEMTKSFVEGDTCFKNNGTECKYFVNFENKFFKIPLWRYITSKLTDQMKQTNGWNV